ncbi:MAG TPA: hypothetical protein VGK00_06170 [Anaerolineales bacterium]|jgi:hypothetical protein
MKPKSSITQLAWQLRTNVLTLENGKVVILPGMLQTAKPEAREIVQERADEINRIISRDDLHPASLAELRAIFDDLENRP